MLIFCLCSTFDTVQYCSTILLNTGLIPVHLVLNMFTKQNYIVITSFVKRILYIYIFRYLLSILGEAFVSIFILHCSSSLSYE